MLAGIAALAASGRWGSAATLAACTAAALWILSERRLPPGFRLAFAAAVVAGAGGWVFGWFHSVPFYDDAAHALGGLGVTLTFGVLVYLPAEARLRDRAGHRLYVLALASFGLSAGALWEIGEWIVMGPLADTAMDLLMDFAGALAAGLVAGARLGRAAGRGVRPR